MKIGYARVSTDDQSLDRQIEALNNEGCERIYKEKISSAKPWKHQGFCMLLHQTICNSMIVRCL